MKTKELNRRVWKKVLETFKAELGYKTSQQLQIWTGQESQIDLKSAAKTHCGPKKPLDITVVTIPTVKHGDSHVQIYLLFKDRNSG